MKDLSLSLGTIMIIIDLGSGGCFSRFGKNVKIYVQPIL